MTNVLLEDTADMAEADTGVGAFEVAGVTAGKGRAG